jgi:hypothetical protein
MPFDHVNSLFALTSRPVFGHHPVGRFPNAVVQMLSIFRDSRENSLEHFEQLLPIGCGLPLPPAKIDPGEEPRCECPK